LLGKENDTAMEAANGILNLDDTQKKRGSTIRQKKGAAAFATAP
jgi:hypothetical protein